MINLQPERSVLTRAELIETRRYRGDWGPIKSSIDLSRPFVAPLTKEMGVGDSELAIFLRGDEGKFRYDYVRLCCSFHSILPERFEYALLTVKLTSDDQSADPVAWSISPSGTYDEVERSSSTKISGNFRIISAEIGNSVRSSEKLFSIRGYGEGSPSPSWEMTANEVSSLEGLLRFHLVVRSPVNNFSKGEASLKTTISNREFMVFRTKHPLDSSPSLEFELPVR